MNAGTAVRPWAQQAHMFMVSETGKNADHVNSNNGPAKKTFSACCKLNLGTNSVSSLTSLGLLDVAGQVLL